MSAPGSPDPSPRTELLARHTEARKRRDAAPLESDEYRAACEEVARIEIAIAAAEEPTPVAAPQAASPAAHAASPQP